MIGTYIKRDKGSLFRSENLDDLKNSLEEDFDNIVTMTNRALRTKEDQTGKVATQVTEIGQTASLVSKESNLERLIYGGENRTIIRPIIATDTVLFLTKIEPGDIIKGITVITKTIDNGITDFKVNDGANDLCDLRDIDTSITSAQTPARAMWIEYTDYKSLTLYLAGATTFVGLIVIEILRKPIQYFNTKSGR